MAEAMLAAFLKQGIVAPKDLTASDISPERLAQLRRQYRIGTAATNLEVARKATILFLAVKPQQLDEVLRELAPAITPRHVVFSIAAGKRLATLQRLLPGTRVIRVMPNLPCLVGAGMTAFCPGRRATAADRRLAARILGAFGAVVELAEKHFDMVTALSGSGPAFFSYFIREMTAAATAGGLPAEAARLLAGQTMLGTARLLLEKQLDPADLIRSVTSAKGTTAAGLAKLDRPATAAILHKTLAAAAQRSRELSQA